MSSASWEYLMLPEAERHQLDALGTQGWELVGIGGSPDAPLLYLKRPGADLKARVTLDQRSSYYASRGLDPDRQPETHGE